MKRCRTRSGDRRRAKRKAEREARPGPQGASYWARSTGWSSVRGLRDFASRQQIWRWHRDGDVRRGIGEGTGEAARGGYVYNLEDVAAAIVLKGGAGYAGRIRERTGVAAGEEPKEEAEELAERLKDLCEPAPAPRDGAEGGGEADDPAAGWARVDPRDYGFERAGRMLQHLREHGERYEDGRDYRGADAGGIGAGGAGRRRAGVEMTAEARARLGSERARKGMRWRR